MQYLDIYLDINERAAQERVSQAEIVERVLRRELGMMERIDLDGVRTAYSTGRTEHEAIQIPWDTVRAILGHDHTGAPDEDRRLVEALIAAGAPDWVQDAPGWIDEHGWGLYCADRADLDE